MLVSLDLQNYDGLRLCSQLRSLERTRNLSVLLLGEAEDKSRVLRGLEIGAHDFLVPETGCEFAFFHKIDIKLESAGLGRRRRD